MGGSGENQNFQQQQHQQALPFESPVTNGVAGDLEGMNYRAAAKEAIAAADEDGERSKPEVAERGRWTLNLLVGHL